MFFLNVRRKASVRKISARLTYAVFGEKVTCACNAISCFGKGSSGESPRFIGRRFPARDWMKNHFLIPEGRIRIAKPFDSLIIYCLVAGFEFEMYLSVNFMSSPFSSVYRLDSRFRGNDVK